MKILHYLFFPGGGIGRYTDQLLRTMSELTDHELEVLCLPEFRYRDNGVYRTMCELRSISHPFPLRRKARFLIGQIVNPRRLVRYARQSRPDVVHISNINHLTRPIWMPALKRLGVPIVASAHDVKRASRIINRRWETRQLRSFYRQCDAIFVHSQNQRQELVEFADVHPSRIHIVPMGPTEYPISTASRRETRNRFGIPMNAFVGLCFGQIRDEKNLGELIAALPAAPSHLHLLIAGAIGSGHRGITHYRNLAIALGVNQRVHFIERFIPDGEVSDLFEASDFIPLTYRQSFTSQSGVLSSAVWFRKPVLASPCPTFVESMHDHRIGLVTDGDDKRSIAEGLNHLIEKCKERDAFSFESFIQQNSWHENARRTLQVYDGLVTDLRSSQSRPSERAS